MTRSPQVERDAKRILVALYRLSKGRPCQVNREDLLAECTRESLFTCSNEEFETYRTKVLEEVRQWRLTQTH